MTKLIDIINEEIFTMNEGIHVYHGTDRKFDTFDMNKVGSGDGNSLGGWGIYFSDSEDVSRKYFLNSGFVKEYEIKSGKYFDFDDLLSENGQSIMANLEDHGVSEEDIQQFQTDYLDYENETTNKQAYEWLSFVLGSEKNASLFLADLGFLGTTFKDRSDPEATNYVVFNPNSIREL